MTRITAIRGLEAKIKKLENTIGQKRRNCPACHYREIRRLLDASGAPFRLRPDELIERRCEICNAKRSINLVASPEDEYKAGRLWCSFTQEEYYTDPIAHAINEWWKHRVRISRRRASGGYAGSAHGEARPQTQKETRGEQLLSQLRKELINFKAEKRKALEAKYGASPFPEQKELIEATRARVHMKRRDGAWSGLEILDMDLERIDYLVCAEMEKIIWGEVFPETVAGIEKMERAIDEAFEKGQIEKQAFHDGLRLKNLKSTNESRAFCGLPPLPDDYGTNPDTST